MRDFFRQRVFSLDNQIQSQFTRWEFSLLFPLLQEFAGRTHIRFDQSDMFLAPWNKLSFERHRPSSQIILVRVYIEFKLLAGF
jgi:hypothetical protein